MTDTSYCTRRHHLLPHLPFAFRLFSNGTKTALTPCTQGLFSLAQSAVGACRFACATRLCAGRSAAIRSATVHFPPDHALHVNAMLFAALDGMPYLQCTPVQWDDWYVHPAVHSVEEAAAKAQQAASASQLQAQPARATHQKGA